ncbi:hypothetical protein OIU79_001265 [Salix purpurea]|uniref:Uncharacterized protein n=1 Tax=Salix purpurea TaxID=77065 RepID=A0A9Q0ZNT1_SALPP|nr:hypothetical protein OIU79_001265 [Salix purpurea]
MFISCSTKKFEPENPTTHYDIGYERQHLPWFSRLFPYSQDHPRLGNYGDFSKECKCLGFIQGLLEETKS